MDRLWEATQSPAEHQRWDLRFTDIHYLPRQDGAAPQLFRYVTRIGFGLQIQGHGETVGAHDTPTGVRSSALRFWSDDPKSLIREGSGYWKYQPRPDGEIRFLTAYDYQTRFGVAGRLADRLVFRPLMGWATAWSFDRLRLWLEDGLDPKVALRAAVSYTLCRVAVASVWLYHGLVPKLLLRHADERAMLGDLGLAEPALTRALLACGAAEVVMGVLILCLWRARWPLWITILLLLVATMGVGIKSPQFLGSAFNAVTLNVTTGVLAGVVLLNRDLIPSGKRCARRPGEDGT